jgi:hypothetical protein
MQKSLSFDPKGKDEIAAIQTTGNALDGRTVHVIFRSVDVRSRELNSHRRVSEVKQWPRIVAFCSSISGGLEYFEHFLEVG